MYLSSLLPLFAFGASVVDAFPSSYGSVAGLTREQLDHYIRLTPRASTGAQPAPGPLSDTSAKLVNDAAHPYIAPKKTDQRGPCPGLNTLANHGYINRTGVDTPQNIVNAAQNGFNMGNNLAVLVTWGAFLVDGNHLTNLMSIGGKTSATGAFPPAPAIVGGLDTHGVFEGDASTTRGDAYFGDNHSFNETLFDQLNRTTIKLSGGRYNFTSAAEFRHLRIQDSIARNPTFDFTTPRFFTAYAESIFPLRFFVDGRQSQTNPSLDMLTMRTFFQTNKMPSNFYRRSGAFNDVGSDFGSVFSPYPMQPGGNDGQVNHYTVNQNDPGFSNPCYIYEKQINQVLARLYPPANTTGALRNALRINVHTFYTTSTTCTETFPYGK